MRYEGLSHRDNPRLNYLFIIVLKVLSIREVTGILVNGIRTF